jgi:hypothetical protein
MPAKSAKVVEEVDEFDGFEVDEDDYSGVTDADDVAHEEPPMTTTKNFMGTEAAIVDEVEDLGIVVVDPSEDDYVVRVIEDIGPVYYGSELVEMKKGHRYRVPPHIYEYLKDRDLLWEQQR